MPTIVPIDYSASEHGPNKGPKPIWQVDKADGHGREVVSRSK